MEKKKDLIMAIIASIIVLASVFWVIGKKQNKTTIDINESIIESDGDFGIHFDDTYKVYLEDESLADIKMEYDRSLKKYIIRVTYKKEEGETLLHIDSPEGKKRTIKIARDKNGWRMGNTNDIFYQ